MKSCHTFYSQGSITSRLRFALPACGRAWTLLGSRENSKPEKCLKMRQNPQRPVHALLARSFFEVRCKSKTTPKTLIRTNKKLLLDFMLNCYAAIHKSKPSKNNCEDSIHNQPDEEGHINPVSKLKLCESKRSYSEVGKISHGSRSSINPTDNAVFCDPIGKCER